MYRSAFFCIISIFFLLVFNTAAAQILVDTSDICEVRYVSDKAPFLHDARPIDSSNLCGSMKGIFKKHNNLSFQVENLYTTYIIKITLTIPPSGIPNAVKIISCSEALQDIVNNEVLPLLKNSSWQPAYIIERKRKKVSKRLVTDNIRFFFTLSKDGMTISCSNNYYHEYTLCRWDIDQ